MNISATAYIFAIQKQLVDIALLIKQTSGKDIPLIAFVRQFHEIMILTMSKFISYFI
jgi:hypothetical protein